MIVLEPLSFSYDALEPYIDSETMQIHHDKHHQAYVDNLNKALDSYSDLASKNVEYLVRNLNELPEVIKNAVRNNAGGHINHSFFWNILKKNNGAAPQGELANAIQNEFGGLEKLKEEITKAALGRFGSGWAWLVSSNNTLKVMSTPNQDSPLSENKFPILGIDVWEHAYYLKYKNRRADYIAAFWNVVDWEKVNENFLIAK